MHSNKMPPQIWICIVTVLSLALCAPGASVSVAMHGPPADCFVSAATGHSDPVSGMALNETEGPVKPMIAAGAYHTVGLKPDGTVVAVGENAEGECDVGSWTDIIQVAAGPRYTLGLRVDGTVIATGRNEEAQCNVGDWTDIVQVASGGLHTVGLKADGTVVAVGQNDHSQCETGDWTDITQVAAGLSHTVGLRSDGTVVAVGRNDHGQCDVEDWVDIVQVVAGPADTVGFRADDTVIAVGYYAFMVDGRTNVIQIAIGMGHIVWLEPDGTVKAVGNNVYGQCNVGGWTDVIQVDAGLWHTVGLKSDGTVLAIGWDYLGQCDVGEWTNIVQVAAGFFHTVGVRSDGTVVAVGWNEYGRCDVGDWMDIIQVAVGGGTTVGLRSDGTVVAVGSNTSGQCQVSDWADIIQVEAGGFYTIGLRSDGTAIAAGLSESERRDIEDWTDIIQLSSAGSLHTVGLRSDGTAVAVGDNSYGQCNVEAWTGIVQVAAGRFHTVGIKSDGTVVATGRNDRGQCDVAEWTGITQVAAGYLHTVGLQSDHTVVATGHGGWGQCNVDQWTGITQITTARVHTVGLRTDGTVVAAGLEVELAKCFPRIDAKLSSPAEIRVRDSQGRVTGIVDGEVWDEIPWATANKEDELVTALYGFDEHCFEVEGLAIGSYGIAVGMTLEGQTIMVTATSVSTAAGSVHRYHIDWYALRRGEPGIMIEKDHDGDGEVDEMVITGIPKTPAEPSPADGANGILLNQALSWAGDESDSVEYNIYFGTDYAELELVSEGQAETTYVPTLSLDTTYCWRVEAINEHSIMSSGGIWGFTTEGATSASPCFIATAAYGTPMTEEIQVLREFRDGYLMTNMLGQAFVDFYYSTSPPIAEFITDHPSLKPMVRTALVPAVGMSNTLVNTSPAQKAAAVGLVVLISMVLSMFAIRQRRVEKQHN